MTQKGTFYGYPQPTKNVGIEDTGKFGLRLEKGD